MANSAGWLQSPILFDFVYEQHHSRILVLSLILDLSVVFVQLVLFSLVGYTLPSCYQGGLSDGVDVAHALFIVTAALASSKWHSPRWIVPAILAGLTYVLLQTTLEVPACIGLDTQGLNFTISTVKSLRLAIVFFDWCALVRLLSLGYQFVQEGRLASTYSGEVDMGVGEDPNLLLPLNKQGDKANDVAVNPTLYQQVVSALHHAPLRHLAAVACSFLSLGCLASLVSSAAGVVPSQLPEEDSGTDDTERSILIYVRIFGLALAWAAQLGSGVACALICAALLQSIWVVAGDAQDLHGLHHHSQRAGGEGGTAYPLTSHPSPKHPLSCLGLIAVKSHDSPFAPPPVGGNGGGGGSGVWASSVDVTIFSVTEAYAYIFLVIANSVAVYLIATVLFTLLFFAFLLPSLASYLVTLLGSALGSYLLKALLHCAFSRCAVKSGDPGQGFSRPRLFLFIDTLFSFTCGAIVGATTGFVRVGIALVAALFDSARVTRPVLPLQMAKWDSAFSTYGAVMLLNLRRGQGGGKGVFGGHAGMPPGGGGGGGGGGTASIPVPSSGSAAQYESIPGTVVPASYQN